MVNPALENAVSRIKLAPGWTVYTYDHPFEGQHVCFVGEVPNSYQDEPTVLKVRSPVPPFQTRRQYFDWLLWRWLIICSHEGREFFRVDDKAWFDPHAEGPEGPGSWPVL